MKTTIIISSISTILILGLFAGCSGLDLSGLDVELPGQNITANWKSPANYARTPTGQNPVNPITLSVDFSDHAGCPNQTYRFWLYSKDGGTPLTGIGTNAEQRFDNHFEQVVNLPINVPVYQIRLACTKANGDRYANSDILESGSPAFTPRYAVSWQNPEGYTRLPTGNQPTNPLTLSVDFADESGCPYQMYQFWSYALNGSPIGPVGPVMTMIPGSGVAMTATLPTGVPINAIRLACVDNEGNRYDNTANLEIGNPAFTPVASGTCSGQNATMCTAPADSSTCTTCGGNWTATPAGTCTGTSSTDGENQCQNRADQTTCETLGVTSTGRVTSLCTWTDSCHVKSTACADQISESLCIDTANNGYGSCTWTATPAGTCTGTSSTDGENQCQNRADQTTCETLGVTSTGRVTSLCTWTDSCHVKSTACADQISESLCIDTANNGYGSCTWGTTPTHICNNPTASLCTSPQTEATCTTCSGTWTTNP